MSEHLSSEQVSRWMMGERGESEEEHVRECGACRADLIRIESALTQFRQSVWQVSQRGSAAVTGERRRQWSNTRPLRWVLAVAALLILTAAPVYRNARVRERKAADKLLMDQVDEAISRTVPRPMEPLIGLVTWGGLTEGKENKR